LRILKFCAKSNGKMGRWKIGKVEKWENGILKYDNLVIWK
jgi:hypothetical protein